MEVALGQLDVTRLRGYLMVLILIVMEVALGPHVEVLIGYSHSSLNPYCNGGRTWTYADNMKELFNIVLILIVMEVALGPVHVSTSHLSSCLNPYCNGGRTWTGIFTNTYKPAEYVLEFKNLNTISCRFNTLLPQS